MSVLAESLPVSRRNLARGAALFLTGAMLMGSLIDCEGEGPQLPSGEGPARQVERVAPGELSPVSMSLGDQALMGVVEAVPIQAPQQVELV